MLDINWIRENPAAFADAMRRRGMDSAVADQWLGTLMQLDKNRREAIAKLQELQTKRNQHAKAIGPKMGQLKKLGGHPDADANSQPPEAQALFAELQTLLVEGKKLAEDIATLEAETGGHGALSNALADIPNIPAEDVPMGADEHDNQPIKHVGEPNNTPDAKAHFELGEALGLMDFAKAAEVSGTRFVYLKGQLARLERALSAFMLDTHTTHFGFTEVNPPVLVKSDALFGTGQLPKFADDLFHTTDDRWLIPTAEVSLTNMVRDAILAEDELPLRLTACTPCFRAEAGAAGRDTRGLIRQHQFSKVELVSITTPEQSAAEHEHMLHAAESILQRLELPYRVVLLCTGDMGFSAQKTYDIEVWLPAQQCYREISSVSNCGDFQARRMQARYRAAEDKKTRLLHTLNGSGLAVGRTLVAVLENYQQPDGSIAIPTVLQPYMGGLKRIL